MKKMLSITLLAIMLVVALAGSVSAATRAELIDEVYSIGTKYGMTAADKVKLERYINTYDIADSKLSTLVEKAKEAATVMDKAGAKNYLDLTEAKKEEVKSIASKAAEAVDGTIVFKAKSADIYHNGKKIESVALNNGKLAYTGTNVAVIAGSIAVIALAAVVLVKRTAR